MPPPYTEQQNPMLGQPQYPGNGQPMQGQAYPPAYPGQGYPPPQGQGYPAPQGQGYPAPQGQGYPAPQGQGYPAPPLGQGQVIAPPGQAQFYNYNQSQVAPGGFQPQYTHNVVVQQPRTGYVVTNGQVERDQMCNAILVTLFCFWPTGVIAILKAMEARSAMARGDTLTAQNQSRSARSMVKVSAIIGIICYCAMVVLIGIYIGLIVNAGVSSYSYDDDDR